MIELGIPITSPILPKTRFLIPYLEGIDQTRIYSNRGPLVRKLEERYAQYFQVDTEKIVVLSSATLAIQGLATILPVEGFKVPDFTFAATGQAILASGKRIDLVDISLQDWQLKTPIGDQDRAMGFIPVMPFGSSVPIESWKKIKNVIYDAAASLGSRMSDHSQINASSAIVYSLHATKIAGCGEGSVVVCGSNELASELRSWSNFGFLEDRISHSLGINAKMSEYSAAVANAVLDDFDSELLEWKDVLNATRETSINLKIDSIVSHYEGVTPYWIAEFPSTEIRDRVAEYLKSKSIESRAWWAAPLSDMPVFKAFDKLPENKNSKLICDIVLGLPLYRGLGIHQINRISEHISEIMTK